MKNEILTGTTRNSQWPLTIASIGLAVAILGLFLPLSKGPPADVSAGVNTLRQIAASRTLRVGYEGYPPYTIKDPSTGKLTGFSVDLADYIAREAGWAVQWVQTSPDTKIPDLQAGRFDVMTEPIFRTIPRAAQVTFSRPYAYFGAGAAIVRKGDNRFKTIDDLNKHGIRLVVRQGYTDETFAADNLPEAARRALKVDDVSQLFLEVITGKADAALSDVEQAKSFAAKHPAEVQARFTDPAPAYIPAGLMLRQGDFTFYNFLNASIDYMEANSVLARLNRKYSISPGQPPSMR